MMFSKAALGLLVALPATALAGQIPQIEGITGGVPTNAQRTSILKEQAGNETSQTTPGKLRVTENSGVCETTNGVYQASGYGDIASDKSIWFWFFEARNDPDNAPLAVWFNGGPGSSSMIGLFQENGPCRINNDSSDVSLNPNSWNNVANVIYVDQPVGVGYSHGTLDVGTSQEAADDIYQFFQIFFNDTNFSKYADRDFAIWTESYGGHYGPTFAAYFLDQNEAIANGSSSGTTINLKYLGVGDGLTDPLSQYPGYITYAANNPYHPLVSDSTIKKANNSYYKSGGCQDQIQSCYDGGSDDTCSQTQSYCNEEILEALAGNWDVYYVEADSNDDYPPDITDYLSSSSLKDKIGAESDWQMTNDQVYENFAATGDWMRNSRPNLEKVINAGVRTLVYDGDADFILNFNGVENMVDNLDTKFSDEYSQQEFQNYTVNGDVTGIYKTAGTFSYVRIYGAGHEVPAYKYGKLSTGEAALQFFTQTMGNNSLSAT